MTMTPSLQKLYETAMQGTAATAAQRPQTNQPEQRPMTKANPPIGLPTKVTIDVPPERLEAFWAFYRDFFEQRGAYDEQAEKAAQEKQDTQTRGVAALRRLYAVAQRDSGQCRYIARFLAGCYNGYRFPFDLTDFRCLDRELFDDCMAVLAMDRQPAQEVHRYFVDGGQKWEDMIRAWGLTDEQAERAREVVAYKDGD